MQKTIGKATLMSPRKALPPSPAGAIAVLYIKTPLRAHDQPCLVTFASKKYTNTRQLTLQRARTRPLCSSLPIICCHQLAASAFSTRCTILAAQPPFAATTLQFTAQIRYIFIKQLQATSARVSLFVTLYDVMEK